MKYIVQVFKTASPDANVGNWSNTAWGSDDRVQAETTAAKIAQGNSIGATKVRVVEVVKELDCANVKWPERTQ